MPFYNKTVEETLKELNTSEKGLSEEETEKRLKQYGKNELKKKESISQLKIFLNQFKNYIIWILFAVVLISIFLQRFIDAGIILAILILNAVLGFVQEFKAEKTIRELSKLTSPHAIVIRDNKKQIISAEELVPGDIIIIETGNYIPADARIIESFNLKVDESILTGESTSVDKNTEITEKEQVTEQKNMLFSSTLCVYGKAKAVVTTTGMKTEIGKIAKEIQKIKETKTPLLEKLNELGKTISIGIIIISLFIFLIGSLLSKDIINTFLVAITIAVAAIPEGLPAIITITLALGLQALSKKNVLVRRLPAVETLGSTTIIASDKTGTLTKNEMTVKKIFMNNNIIEVTGEGYDTEGNFKYDHKKVKLEDLKQLMQIAYLCNNSDLNSLTGDPTELALKVVAKKSKVNIKKYEKVDEIPFSSEEKYMATKHTTGKREFYYFKGAPEKILDMCSYVHINGRTKWMSKKDKEKILNIGEEMASEALRVLGFAYSKGKSTKNLVFTGLIGMIDPPRKEVKGAIELAEKAGVRVIMITGDHKETAKAIAKEVGITGKIITGEDIDNMTNYELKKLSKDINVYARVTPKHKIKILETLDPKKEVIAMTGDGVNDAPALKKADIGISLESGTDVAKQASEMILKDNNFSSIVDAIEIGRGIYRNIKKFIYYLLSCNLGELITIFIATVFGFPLVLLPIHILWVNLVTDGFPALALGMEPVEKSVMHSKPRKKNSPIINKKNAVNMILSGILIAAGTLFMFKIYNNYFGLMYAQTISFTTLMMFQMFNALNARTSDSIFKTDFFSNKKLLYAIALSILLQIIIIYLFGSLFQVTQLTLIDWLYVMLVSSSILIFMEIRKFIFKKETQ